jgi:short-subunit dehydrogenase
VAFVVLFLSYLIIKRLRINRRNRNKWDLSQVRRLNVVITGGTKGIGLSLARLFCSKGHRVIVCGRNEAQLQSAIREMRMQVPYEYQNNINGTICDITSAPCVDQFVSFIQKTWNNQPVHAWINNAAVSASANKPLHEMEVDEIENTINVNILGLILATRAAVRLMLNQPKGGHVFNMEGAGSRGAATPNISIYGCSKAAVSQFTRSIEQELIETKIGVHRLSPGMVITNLLVKESTPLKAKKIFNILAEECGVVSPFLYDCIRHTKGTGTRNSYLTPLGVIYRFATFFMRKNRFFDEKTGELIDKKIVR